MPEVRGPVSGDQGAGGSLITTHRSQPIQAPGALPGLVSLLSQRLTSAALQFWRGDTCAQSAACLTLGAEQQPPTPGHQAFRGAY